MEIRTFMKNNEYQSEKPGLRTQAEAVYDQTLKSVINCSGENAEKLIHELKIHQIELEMQNEELRSTQNKLDALLLKYFELYDLAPVGYFTMDTNGLIVQANLTVAELLELKRSNLIRAPFSQFILSDSQDQYYLLLKEVINTGKEKNCELRLKNNGPGFFANVYIAPVLDDKKVLSELRVVVTDISSIKSAQYERNKAEAQRHLTHQLLKVRENERQAISSHLHENVAQDLAAIKLGFESLLNEKNGLFQSAQHEMQRLSGLLIHCIGAVRDLSYELWPPLMDQLGLAQALRKQCAMFSEKTGLPVAFSCSGTMECLELDRNIRINLYRIVQEGLCNIRQHALAKNAVVELIHTGSTVLLNIVDNGAGFETVNELSKKTLGIGLQCMEGWASSAGGEMKIFSEPGAGCRISVELPLMAP